MKKPVKKPKNPKECRSAHQIFSIDDDSIHDSGILVYSVLNGEGADWFNATTARRLASWLNKAADWLEWKEK